MNKNLGSKNDSDFTLNWNTFFFWKQSTLVSVVWIKKPESKNDSFERKVGLSRYLKSYLFSNFSDKLYFHGLQKSILEVKATGLSNYAVTFT